MGSPQIGVPRGESPDYDTVYEGLGKLRLSHEYVFLLLNLPIFTGWLGIYFWRVKRCFNGPANGPRKLVSCFFDTKYFIVCSLGINIYALFTIGISRSIANQIPSRKVNTCRK